MKKFKSLMATLLVLAVFLTLVPATLADSTYTYNTPLPVTKNGVTATVTYSKPSPQPTGESVVCYITLKGSPTLTGTYNIGISGKLSGQEEVELTAGQDLTATPKVVEVAFNVPDYNVIDVEIVHDFVARKVSSVTIVGNELPVLIFNGTEAESQVQLSATVLPANATQTDVVWEVTSGSEYVSVDQTGKVTAIAPGIATVTVTAKDGSGKSDSRTIVVEKQYSIIQNDNSTFKKGTPGGLVIVCDGEFGIADGPFRTAFVDNADFPLTAEMGKIEAGSTKVTLYTSYLDTLSVGQHTLTFVYANGRVTANFTVAKADAKVPQTGDNTGLALTVSLMALSGAAALLLILANRKRKNEAE